MSKKPKVTECSHLQGAREFSSILKRHENEQELNVKEQQIYSPKTSRILESLEELVVAN